MVHIFYHQNNYKRINSNFTLETLADTILMKRPKVMWPVFHCPVPPDMMRREAKQYFCDPPARHG